MFMFSDIADAASDNQDLLVPDVGAHYDRLIQINLNEVFIILLRKY